MKQYLSLGAGVQSSTLLLKSCFAPEGARYDAAIFADTGDEPKPVYEHLEWLEQFAWKHGIPVYRVSAGNLRQDVEDQIATGRFGSIPLHVLGSDGGRGMLRRQCTREYKIEPIIRKIRTLLGVAAKGPVPDGETVQLCIGISWDEQQRMKNSGAAWIIHRWPLVEEMMTRVHCLTWLHKHDFPTPPKSSCLMCPYHSRNSWVHIAQTQPEEWERLKDLDRRLRHVRGDGDGLSFLHRDCIPLEAVDVRSDRQKGILSLFGSDMEDECDGVCGV